MSNEALESLEDDLFRFGRIVASTPGLRDALTDRDLEVAARQGLVTQLLEGKVPATTLALVRYAVTGGRARDFVGTIAFLVEQTAQPGAGASPGCAPRRRSTRRSGPS